MEAGGAHLDVLVLREEEEHPGAGGGRRVLSGEQQTNQHAGDLVISHVTPTPARRSQLWRLISQSRYRTNLLTYHRNSKTIIAIVLRQCNHCRDTIVMRSWYYRDTIVILMMDLALPLALLNGRKFNTKIKRSLQNLTVHQKGAEGRPPAETVAPPTCRWSRAASAACLPRCRRSRAAFWSLRRRSASPWCEPRPSSCAGGRRQTAQNRSLASGDAKMGAWPREISQWGLGLGGPHNGGLASGDPTMGAWPRETPQWGLRLGGSQNWGLGLAEPHNGGLASQDARMGAWTLTMPEWGLGLGGTLIWTWPRGTPRWGLVARGDARMRAKTWTMPKWGLDLTRCQNVS